MLHGRYAKIFTDFTVRVFSHRTENFINYFVYIMLKYVLHPVQCFWKSDTYKTVLVRGQLTSFPHASRCHLGKRIASSSQFLTPSTFLCQSQHLSHNFVDSGFVYVAMWWNETMICGALWWWFSWVDRCRHCRAGKVSGPVGQGVMGQHIGHIGCHSLISR